jgi:hypothetical protein
MSSSQLGSFDWKWIDESLANAMLLQVSIDIRKLIRQDEMHIYFLNIGNENSATAPSQRLQMQLLRSDEWAARTYEVYCEVWRLQQHNFSPVFLRAVCRHGIRVLISARVNSVTAELAMEQNRTNSYNNEWLKAFTAGFRQNMELLFGKWQRWTEVNAKGVQYMMEAAPDNPLVEAIATEITFDRLQVQYFEARIASTEARLTAAEQALSAMQLRPPDTHRIKTIEQIVDELKADRQEFRSRLADSKVSLNAALSRSVEVTRPKMPDKHVAQTVGGHDDSDAAIKGSQQLKAIPKLTFRSEMKRAIALLLSIDPDASDLEICRRFDDDGAVELPDSWRSDDNRFFELAYKDPQHKPKIEKMISKVRTEMRRKGLLS